MLFETEQTDTSCTSAVPVSASPGSPQYSGGKFKDLTANNSSGYGAGAVTDATPTSFLQSLGNKLNEPLDIRANVDFLTNENGPAFKPIVKTISDFCGYIAAPRIFLVKASTTSTRRAKIVQPDKRGML